MLCLSICPSIPPSAESIACSLLGELVPAPLLLQALHKLCSTVVPLFPHCPARTAEQTDAQASEPLGTISCSENKPFPSHARVCFAYQHLREITQLHCLPFTSPTNDDFLPPSNSPLILRHSPNKHIALGFFSPSSWRRRSNCICHL